MTSKESSRLLQLVGYGDLKGDLQVHTNNTDGKMTIEEMAYYAKEGFGLDYIAITDHTKSLKITKGLDEEQILNQANEIAELNDKIKNGSFFSEHTNKENSTFTSNDGRQESDGAAFSVLSSAEVNILRDGYIGHFQ